MNVVEHLERYCGLIVGGRKAGPDGEGMPFQIVRLERGPVDGSVTFSTLGLNFHQLKSATSSQLIRHELVMLARIGAVPKNLTAVLQQVAAEAITRGHAYLRGEVLGPRGRLFAESEFTSLYVSSPSYFPREFAAVGRVAFAWLIPITTEEARFVAANGWPEFENLLEREDPDLLDLQRPSLS